MEDQNQQNLPTEAPQIYVWGEVLYAEVTGQVNKKVGGSDTVEISVELKRISSNEFSPILFKSSFIAQAGQAFITHDPSNNEEIVHIIFKKPPPVKVPNGN